MYALIDGNNFYASCERVFEPSLFRRPLVVLSNNDGCAIARSQEAKDIGVGMGQPAHELRDLVRHKGLVLRSANFGLYGDLSNRIDGILREVAPRVERYSIDESFITLEGIRRHDAFARALRARIERWTGIPNCIGIAPTKTLAKLANRMAKKSQGVLNLSDPVTRHRALANAPIGAIWGVGRRLSLRLQQQGIMTAADLAWTDPDNLRSQYGVVLARTQRELQGHSCLQLEDIVADRQQILVSRSFANRIDNPQDIVEALASFAMRAAEKLRSQQLSTAAVSVFVHSDRHRSELPQHQAQRALPLPHPSDDSRVVLEAVRQLLPGLLRPGVGYKKAGIMLLDLARNQSPQQSLFPSPSCTGRDPRLMAVMDQINQRYGRGTLGLAATGWKAQPAWAMRQAMRSPDYTTDVDQLPRVRC